MGSKTPNPQLSVGHRGSHAVAPKHIADREAEEIREQIGAALRGRVGHEDWVEGDGDVPAGLNGGRHYYLRGPDDTVTLDDLEGGDFLPLKEHGRTQHLDWTARLQSYRGGTAIYAIDDDPSLP